MPRCSGVRIRGKATVLANDDQVKNWRGGDRRQGGRGEEGIGGQPLAGLVAVEHTAAAPEAGEVGEGSPTAAQAARRRAGLGAALLPRVLGTRGTLGALLLRFEIDRGGDVYRDAKRVRIAP